MTVDVSNSRFVIGERPETEESCALARRGVAAFIAAITRGPRAAETCADDAPAYGPLGKWQADLAERLDINDPQAMWLTESLEELANV